MCSCFRQFFVRLRTVGSLLTHWGLYNLGVGINNEATAYHSIHCHQVWKCQDEGSLSQTEHHQNRTIRGDMCIYSIYCQPFKHAQCTKADTKYNLSCMHCQQRGKCTAVIESTSSSQDLLLPLLVFYRLGNYASKIG